MEGEELLRGGDVIGDGEVVANNNIENNNSGEVMEKGTLSPLTGSYLLIVLAEPHSEEDREIILQRLNKGLLSWDVDSSHVDLSCELLNLTNSNPEGDEARNGEKLVQWASENLVVEVLIHSQVNTLQQCMKNLLASFTRHRHIIHAGYTFQGSGSWILQDGTFSLSDYLELWSEVEVQRILAAYKGDISVTMHCASEDGWTTERLCREPFAKLCQIQMNPPDKMSKVHNAGIGAFIEFISKMLTPSPLKEILEPSDIVGNIRFSHPTLYVFPGGQGDAALFGINGFNMLIDGGFARKACFWEFTRHLDRLDAVLLTRMNNNSVGGLSSVIQRKVMSQVYPQVGHFFGNIFDRKASASAANEDKKGGESSESAKLLVSLNDEGHRMVENLRNINLKPHLCFREATIEPINLYQKVGHGKLDLYVLNPAKDSREVKEFLSKWNSDCKSFVSARMSSRQHGETKDFQFPVLNLVSICALLVWQPANPRDPITRILFPGSTPQHKIFEALGKLKHLEFLKYPVCSAKTLAASHKSKIKSEKIISEAKEQLLSKVEEQMLQKDAAGSVPRSVSKTSSSSTVIHHRSSSKASKEDISASKDRTSMARRAVSRSNAALADADSNKTKSESPIQKSSRQIKSTATSRIDTGLSGKAPSARGAVKKQTATTADTAAPNKKSPTSPPPTSKKLETTAGRVKSKATDSSPPQTPPKSAKDQANNRRVIEHKTKQASSTTTTAAKTEKSLSSSKAATGAVDVKRKTISKSSIPSSKSSPTRKPTASATKRAPVSTAPKPIRGVKKAAGTTTVTAAGAGAAAAAAATAASLAAAAEDQEAEKKIQAETNGTTASTEELKTEHEDAKKDAGEEEEEAVAKDAAESEEPQATVMEDEQPSSLQQPASLPFESGSELSSLDHISVQEDEGQTVSADERVSSVVSRYQYDTETVHGAETEHEEEEEEDEYLIVEKDESTTDNLDERERPTAKATESLDDSSVPEVQDDEGIEVKIARDEQPEVAKDEGKEEDEDASRETTTAQVPQENFELKDDKGEKESEEVTEAEKKPAAKTEVDQTAQKIETEIVQEKAELQQDEEKEQAAEETESAEKRVAADAKEESSAEVPDEKESSATEIKQEEDEKAAAEGQEEGEKDAPVTEAKEDSQAVEETAVSAVKVTDVAASKDDAPTQLETKEEAAATQKEEEITTALAEGEKTEIAQTESVETSEVIETTKEEPTKDTTVVSEITAETAKAGESAMTEAEKAASSEEKEEAAAESEETKTAAPSEEKTTEPSAGDTTTDEIAEQEAASGKDDAVALADELKAAEPLKESETAAADIDAEVASADTDENQSPLGDAAAEIQKETKESSAEEEKEPATALDEAKDSTAADKAEAPSTEKATVAAEVESSATATEPTKESVTEPEISKEVSSVSESIAAESTSEAEVATKTEVDATEAKVGSAEVTEEFATDKEAAAPSDKKLTTETTAPLESEATAPAVTDSVVSSETKTEAPSAAEIGAKSELPSAEDRTAASATEILYTEEIAMAEETGKDAPATEEGGSSATVSSVETSAKSTESIKEPIEAPLVGKVIGAPLDSTPAPSTKETEEPESPILTADQSPSVSQQAEESTESKTDESKEPAVIEPPKEAIKEPEVTPEQTTSSAADTVASSSIISDTKIDTKPEEETLAKSTSTQDEKGPETKEADKIAATAADESVVEDTVTGSHKADDIKPDETPSAEPTLTSGASLAETNTASSATEIISSVDSAESATVDQLAASDVTEHKEDSVPRDAVKDESAEKAFESGVASAPLESTELGQCNVEEQQKPPLPTTEDDKLSTGDKSPAQQLLEEAAAVEEKETVSQEFHGNNQMFPQQDKVDHEAEPLLQSEAEMKRVEEGKKEVQIPVGDAVTHEKKVEEEEKHEQAAASVPSHINEAELSQLVEKDQYSTVAQEPPTTEDAKKASSPSAVSSSTEETKGSQSGEEILKEITPVHVDEQLESGGQGETAIPAAPIVGEPARSVDQSSSEKQGAVKDSTESKTTGEKKSEQLSDVDKEISSSVPAESWETAVKVVATEGETVVEASTTVLATTITTTTEQITSKVDTSHEESVSKSDAVGTTKVKEKLSQEPSMPQESAPILPEERAGKDSSQAVTREILKEPLEAQESGAKVKENEDTTAAPKLPAEKLDEISEDMLESTQAEVTVSNDDDDDVAPKVPQVKDEPEPKEADEKGIVKETVASLHTEMAQADIQKAGSETPVVPAEVTTSTPGSRKASSVAGTHDDTQTPDSAEHGDEKKIVEESAEIKQVAAQAVSTITAAAEEQARKLSLEVEQSAEEPKDVTKVEDSVKTDESTTATSVQEAAADTAVEQAAAESSTEKKSQASDDTTVAAADKKSEAAEDSAVAATKTEDDKMAESIASASTEAVLHDEPSGAAEVSQKDAAAAQPSDADIVETVEPKTIKEPESAPVTSKDIIAAAQEPGKPAERKPSIASESTKDTPKDEPVSEPTQTSKPVESAVTETITELRESLSTSKDEQISTAVAKDVTPSTLIDSSDQITKDEKSADSTVDRSLQQPADVALTQKETTELTSATDTAEAVKKTSLPASAERRKSSSAAAGASAESASESITAKETSPEQVPTDSSIPPPPSAEIWDAGKLQPQRSSQPSESSPVKQTESHDKDIIDSATTLQTVSTDSAQQPDGDQKSGEDVPEKGETVEKGSADKRTESSQDSTAVSEVITSSSATEVTSKSSAISSVSGSTDITQITQEESAAIKEETISSHADSDVTPPAQSHTELKKQKLEIQFLGEKIITSSPSTADLLACEKIVSPATEAATHIVAEQIAAKLESLEKATELFEKLEHIAQASSQSSTSKESEDKGGDLIKSPEVMMTTMSEGKSKDYEEITEQTKGAEQVSGSSTTTTTKPAEIPSRDQDTSESKQGEQEDDVIAKPWDEPTELAATLAVESAHVGVGESASKSPETAAMKAPPQPPVTPGSTVAAETVSPAPVFESEQGAKSGETVEGREMNASKIQEITSLLDTNTEPVDTHTGGSLDTFQQKQQPEESLEEKYEDESVEKEKKVMETPAVQQSNELDLSGEKAVTADALHIQIPPGKVSSTSTTAETERQEFKKDDQKQQPNDDDDDDEDKKFIRPLPYEESSLSRVDKLLRESQELIDKERKEGAKGTVGIPSAIPSKLPRESREVIRTPDEVADLPVHEEVEPGTYETDELIDEPDTEEQSTEEDQGVDAMGIANVPPASPIPPPQAAKEHAEEEARPTKPSEEINVPPTLIDTTTSSPSPATKPETLNEFSAQVLPTKCDAAVSPVLESLLTESRKSFPQAESQIVSETNVIQTQAQISSEKVSEPPKETSEEKTEPVKESANEAKIKPDGSEPSTEKGEKVEAADTTDVLATLTAVQKGLTDVLTKTVTTSVVITPSTPPVVTRDPDSGDQFSYEKGSAEKAEKEGKDDADVSGPEEPDQGSHIIHEEKKGGEESSTAATTASASSSTEGEKSKVSSLAAGNERERTLSTNSDESSTSSASPLTAVSNKEGAAAEPPAVSTRLEETTTVAGATTAVQPTATTGAKLEQELTELSACSNDDADDKGESNAAAGVEHEEEDGTRKKLFLLPGEEGEGDKPDGEIYSATTATTDEPGMGAVCSGLLTAATTLSAAVISQSPEEFATKSFPGSGSESPQQQQQLLHDQSTKTDTLERLETAEKTLRESLVETTAGFIISGALTKETTAVKEEKTSTTTTTSDVNLIAQTSSSSLNETTSQTVVTTSGSSSSMADAPERVSSASHECQVGTLSSTTTESNITKSTAPVSAALATKLLSTTTDRDETVEGEKLEEQIGICIDSSSSTTHTTVEKDEGKEKQDEEKPVLTTTSSTTITSITSRGTSAAGSIDRTPSPVSPISATTHETKESSSCSNLITDSTTTQTVADNNTDLGDPSKDQDSTRHVTLSQQQHPDSRKSSIGEVVTPEQVEAAEQLVTAVIEHVDRTVEEKAKVAEELLKEVEERLQETAAAAVAATEPTTNVGQHDERRASETVLIADKNVGDVPRTTQNVSSLPQQQDEDEEESSSVVVEKAEGESLEKSIPPPTTTTTNTTTVTMETHSAPSPLTESNLEQHKSLSPTSGPPGEKHEDDSSLATSSVLDSSLTTSLVSSFQSISSTTATSQAELITSSSGISTEIISSSLPSSASTTTCGDSKEPTSSTAVTCEKDAAEKTTKTEAVKIEKEEKMKSETSDKSATSSSLSSSTHRIEQQQHEQDESHVEISSSKEEKTKKHEESTATATTQAQSHSSTFTKESRSVTTSQLITKEESAARSESKESHETCSSLSESSRLSEGTSSAPLRGQSESVKEQSSSEQFAKDCGISKPTGALSSSSSDPTARATTSDSSQMSQSTLETSSLSSKILPSSEHQASSVTFTSSTTGLPAASIPTAKTTYVTTTITRHYSTPAGLTGEGVKGDESTGGRRASEIIEHSQEISFSGGSPSSSTTAGAEMMAGDKQFGEIAKERETLRTTRTTSPGGSFYGGYGLVFGSAAAAESEENPTDEESVYGDDSQSQSLHQDQQQQKQGGESNQSIITSSSTSSEKTVSSGSKSDSVTAATTSAFSATTITTTTTFTDKHGGSFEDMMTMRSLGDKFTSFIHTTSAGAAAAADMMDEGSYSSGDFSDSQLSTMAGGVGQRDLDDVDNLAFDLELSRPSDDNGNLPLPPSLTSATTVITTSTVSSSSSVVVGSSTVTVPASKKDEKSSSSTGGATGGSFSTEFTTNVSAPSSSSRQKEAEDDEDIVKTWGKPLGLPPVQNEENKGEASASAPAEPENAAAASSAAATAEVKGTPKKDKSVDRKNPETPGRTGHASSSSTNRGRPHHRSSRNCSPIYVDLAYVPHHGNSNYCDSEFFRLIRARYYVFSGLEPSRQVFDGLLQGKQSWDDKNLEVTIIPTYDTDTLGYWVVDSEDALAEARIDLAPSASRCTINLQDHETSCAAYRLEF